MPPQGEWSGSAPPGGPLPGRQPPGQTERGRLSRQDPAASLRAALCPPVTGLSGTSSPESFRLGMMSDHRGAAKTGHRSPPFLPQPPRAERPPLQGLCPTGPEGPSCPSVLAAGRAGWSCGGHSEAGTWHRRASSGISSPRDARCVGGLEQRLLLGPSCPGASLRPAPNTQEMPLHLAYRRVSFQKIPEGGAGS